MYAFEDCEVDPQRFELRRSGRLVHVEPQVFALLTYLIGHRDRVITKTELLDSVWGNRYVSESALTSRVKALRRAVGDDGVRQRIIATVHGIGYRFVAPVLDVDGSVTVRDRDRVRSRFATACRRIGCGWRMPCRDRARRW